MLKLCFVNNKGGCGKTTSIFQIAGVLSEQGKRVLVIDLDGQCNATMTVLGNAALPAATIYDVLRGDAQPELAIAAGLYAGRGCRNLAAHGIDCMTGDSRLLDSMAFSSFDGSGLAALLHFLTASDYDAVLVDMPPSNSGANAVGFRIADYVVVPMTSSDMFAAQGYAAITASIDAARTYNPTLRILGVFFSNYFANPMQEWVATELEAACGDVLMQTRIPRSSAVAISTVNARPLAAYAGKEKATAAYIALTEEILSRI